MRIVCADAAGAVAARLAPMLIPTSTKRVSPPLAPIRRARPAECAALPVRSPVRSLRADAKVRNSLFT